MPRVSESYGIVIYMYYNDHAPPRFHALYGGREALFAIAPLDILSGDVPRRVRTLVVEWASLHRDEIAANRESARQGLTLRRMPPLD